MSGGNRSKKAFLSPKPSSNLAVSSQEDEFKNLVASKSKIES